MRHEIIHILDMTVEGLFFSYAHGLYSKELQYAHLKKFCGSPHFVGKSPDS
jgi:hypothetical protein